LATKRIPDDIKQAATDLVAAFNRTEISEPQCVYVPRFKGRYLYLDRVDFGTQGPICRLTYTGDLTHWDFAIYKYSDGAYDPSEWLFPGAEEVDGTIAGALRAGLKAYPA
jgi:hypothetical protein